MFTIVLHLSAFLKPTTGNAGIEWTLNLELENFIYDLTRALSANLRASKRPIKFILTADVQAGDIIHLPMTGQHHLVMTVPELLTEINRHLERHTQKLPNLKTALTQTLTPLKNLEKSIKNAMMLITACPESAHYFETHAALGHAIHFDLTYALVKKHTDAVLHTLQKTPGTLSVFLDIDGTLNPSNLAQHDLTQTYVNEHVVRFCQEITQTGQRRHEFLICTARLDLTTLVQRRLKQECEQELEALGLEPPPRFIKELEQQCLFTQVHQPKEFQAELSRFYQLWADALNKLVRTLKPKGNLSIQEALQSVREKQKNIVKTCEKILGGTLSTPAICHTFTKIAGIAIAPEKGIFTGGAKLKADHIFEQMQRIKPSLRPAIIVIVDDQRSQLDRFYSLQDKFTQLGIKLHVVKVVIPGEYDPELLQGAIKYLRQSATSDLTPHKKPRFFQSGDEYSDPERPTEALQPQSK